MLEKNRVLRKTTRDIKNTKTSVHGLMRNERRKIGLSQKMNRAIMTPINVDRVVPSWIVASSCSEMLYTIHEIVRIKISRANVTY